MFNQCYCTTDRLNAVCPSCTIIFEPDASQRRRLAFRPGRRPRMLVQRPWSVDGFPVQLGLRVAVSCGVVARARAVVRRDGGPVGCRGGGPETLSVLWSSRRVGFFIYVWASRVCSSHSSHGVFSPAVVKGRLVLAMRCFRVCSWVFSSLGGLGPLVCVGVAPCCCGVVWFSPGFPLINWAPSS
jgi:hypothetical protein